jgi:hypothetical protein
VLVVAPALERLLGWCPRLCERLRLVVAPVLERLLLVVVLPTIVSDSVAPVPERLVVAPVLERLLLVVLNC